MSSSHQKPSVLFLCTHNSARSQIAEGLLRARHGDRFKALSAGTVATIVKPEAIAVMAEIGVDISHQRSRSIDEFEGEQVDYVVSVCDDAAEACPHFRARIARIHRSFVDPSGETSSPEARLEAFRRTREELRSWIDKAFKSSRPMFEA